MHTLNNVKAEKVALARLYIYMNIGVETSCWPAHTKDQCVCVCA